MDKGAHFYQCDFQVHTPRDQNWKGKDAVGQQVEVKIDVHPQRTPTRMELHP
jgi:hypothetical protein